MENTFLSAFSLGRTTRCRASGRGAGELIRVVAPEHAEWRAAVDPAEQRCSRQQKKRQR
jgi:hypothetical protein